MPEALVVDACVAIKWFAPEELSDRAVALLEGAYRLDAPDFLLYETDQYFAKLARRSVSLAEARQMRQDLRGVSLRLHDSSKLRDQAFELAAQTRRSLYDCLYLALAVKLGGKMVTADQPFYKEIKKTALSGQVLWLGDI